MDALLAYRGWGVGIKNISNGYMLVFSRKLMVTGPCFDGLTDFSAVVAAVASHLSLPQQA
jgi:hypothetical protein